MPDGVSKTCATKSVNRDRAHLPRNAGRKRCATPVPGRESSPVRIEMAGPGRAGLGNDGAQRSNSPDRANAVAVLGLKAAGMS
jgi:hypothetical protein